MGDGFGRDSAGRSPKSEILLLHELCASVLNERVPVERVLHGQQTREDEGSEEESLHPNLQGPTAKCTL